jgi:hypothetical protein
MLNCDLLLLPIQMLLPKKAITLINIPIFHEVVMLFKILLFLFMPSPSLAY